MNERERLDLSREDAQEVIVESKRLTLELCDLRDRLRRNERREKAQNQQLIAETQAVILKSRELLDRLRNDRQREEERAPVSEDANLDPTYIVAHSSPNVK